MALTKEEIEAIPLGKPKHDGDGLWITKSAKQGRLSFTYRFSWKGRRPEMAVEAKTVAEARKAIKILAGEVAAGRNPLEARKNAAALREQSNTFGTYARTYIENKKGEWKGGADSGSYTAWMHSIFGTPKKASPAVRSQSGLPTLLNIPIVDITTKDIVAALAPAYVEKPIAAEKLRVRIGCIIEAAREEGLFPADRLNPAKARRSFPAFRHKVKNRASLPYKDAPAIVAEIRTLDLLSAAALELAILTALRPMETAGARWAEFDLDARIWNVTDERMKDSKPWRVPLSEAAVRILDRQAEVRTNEFVFPSYGKHRHITPGAMLDTVRKFCDPDEASTHGFRSTVVEYAVQVLRVERWLADLCLSHKQGTEVSRAYQRDDLVELRREIMDAWADYLAGKEVKPLR